MAASPIALPPPFPRMSLNTNFRDVSRSISLTSPTMSNEMLSHPPKPSHTCPSCSRTFSRAEHLDRHLTTHLPSNSSKSFICTSCGKGFTRKDVLTRHVRAVHETKRSDVRRSRRRSCRRCAGFKIKCSGGGRGSADGSRGDEACEACKKRGVTCVYDFGSPPESSSHMKSGQDQTRHMSNGSGDDDGIMDDISEEGRSDPGLETTPRAEDMNKRRRISDGYVASAEQSRPSAVTRGTNVSHHLLSAAILASGQRIAEETGFDEDSFGAASAVASLVNSTDIRGHRTTDLHSADHLMSMLTSKTYEDGIPAHQGAKPLVSPFGNGDRNSYFSQILPPLNRSSQHRSLSLSRQNSTQGSSHESPQPNPSVTPTDLLSSFQHPIQSESPRRRAYESPFARSVTDEDLHTVNTPQAIPPTTSGPNSSSPQPHYFSRETIIIGDGPASGMPGILPPVSFHLSNDEFSNMQSPKGFSAPVMNPMEARRDEVLGSPAPDNSHLESDDNWFFDAGIFETDWLRWGFDSDAPVDVDTVPGSCPLSERHMSTCSNSSMNGAAPGLTNSRTNSNSASKDLSSPSSSTSDSGTYPPHNREVRLPSVSPIKGQSSLDDFLPWGWQTSREEPKKRITLPPLRQVLEECSTQRMDPNNPAFSPRFSSSADSSIATDRFGNVTDQLRNDLIGVLKVPYARHPYYDDCDIESKFPNKDVIDGFIALYFKHFHSILPMIHRPTFRVDKCPSILLVAMASIGASYSDVEGAKVFADSLSELCKRALTWMAEYDPAYHRSEYYLTAFCLQLLYALGSGNSGLYDAADSTRSFLVSNARRCGLFFDTTSPYPQSQPSSSAPNSPKGYGSSTNYCPGMSGEDRMLPRSNCSPSTGDEQSLQSRWLSWCEQEKRKRVLWAIFGYDCSFSTLSNRRGTISINDIQARLPCDEAMWEAPTALAWAAILPPSSSPSSSVAYRGMPFYPTLRDVMSGKANASNISSWGKELCAWALGRLLWDFKEMEQSAVGCGAEGGGGGLGLPTLTAGLKPAKETCLKALVTLGEAARESEELEGDRGRTSRRSLTCLIAHYSHLHSAVPTLSLILSLSRHPPKSSADVKVDARITRLKALFTADPIHARALAWHAGQIIGISRHRPVHTPAETMRVFLAGVVLWGVGKWFVECRPNSSDVNVCSHPSAGEHSVQLDALPFTNGNSMTRSPSSASNPPTFLRGYDKELVNEWIKTGRGIATIRRDGESDYVGEAQLCSEQGSRDVLQVVIGILSRMRIWGLGAEFRRVLEGMGR